ncbi:hypothetical protein NQ315_015316 [Exocentrus adspersus]|uniref:Transposase domain-containing protein n=1 Tax=Exocentrus adspersus TaxID=1586481 RepID=A0AAV8V6N8_9CUCU|nr:hypothetical protein NQ315_015316 [Exocentrus adspersus]
MLPQTQYLEPGFSSDNNSENQNGSTMTLLVKLKHWATTPPVTHAHVTSLLHILSPYHPELPLDARTLLKTPRSMVAKTLENGHYCHIGLEQGLQILLKRNYKIAPKSLTISFNIDGIPLFHSSTLQLWPILAEVKNVKSSPFAVGIFCGKSKPKPLELYLMDFITEVLHLLEKGFLFQGQKYSVEIHSLICDAPARAYLKCIKSHGGYSSCEKCTDPGEYIDGRVVLSSLCAPYRTDENFSHQIDDDHHIGTSPLISLPIGMVTKFPIDYMHNCCLGVMRKLFNTWIGGPLRVRLTGRQVSMISEHLESLKLYIPVEFNRKPRPLSELPRWKATELRTIAIMVSSKHLSTFGTNCPKKLLSVFVKHCVDIYGTSFLIYNVHMLLHLSRDVDIYGSLDNFSAFSFENYLGFLKGLVKSTINPLQENPCEGCP